MAYQILEYVHQPGIRQGDELVYFTQSVIKMEREISQITKEQKTKAQVHNTPTIPTSVPYTPEWLRIGLDGENICSRLIESRKSVQADKSAESVRLAEDLRQERLAFTSREHAFESAAETEGKLQHTNGPRRHMTESRNSIVWTPPQTPQIYKDFKPSDCNITLSRVYFAQGSERNSDQVPVYDYKCTRSDPETFEIPQNHNIADKEKNSFVEKLIVPSRRQSAPSSFNSSVAKPSPLFGGRFQNPQPAGRGYRKCAGKRLSSETEEYIYFLPECQEPRPKPLRRDAICSKSYSISDEYSPPVKRSKPDQEVPEIIVIPDENEVVTTRQSRNKESNLMQVVTDSEGRIHVNVAITPAPERQHVEVTKPIIGHEGHNALKKNHGELEKNMRKPSNGKECLEIHECSSEAINFENQTAETCNHISALITNDHRWDAWKRANCIPCEEFDHYTKYDHCRTVQSSEGERYIIGSQDENNNNSSGVETPHLNKFNHTPSHSVPDRSMISHAKAAKQNFIKYCEQTTQKERCTERFSNIPKENCSENHQSLLKNNQRFACMDKDDTRCQKTQISTNNDQVKGPLVGVNDRRTICKHNFRNKTQRCSVQALKEDAGCKYSNECETALRQEKAVMKDNRKDLAVTILSGNRNNDGQTSSSVPSRSKASRIKNSSNTDLSMQPTTEKKNSVSGFRKEMKTRKVSTPPKQTLTKSSGSIEFGGRYQCDWPACDKTFRHYSFLVLHKRIHTGERPYVCSWEGCTKQFRRSDDYQRHYRVHTGDKPYVCMFCGKGFKRSDHRLFHYRAIHHIAKDVDKKKKKINEIRQDISNN